MFKRLTVWIALVAILSMLGSVKAELVGHWKLDDAGTVAVDSSGNGNDGTLQGTPAWVAGQLGGALEVYGSDWVDCGQCPGLRRGHHDRVLGEPHDSHRDPRIRRARWSLCPQVQRHADSVHYARCHGSLRRQFRSGSWDLATCSRVLPTKSGRRADFLSQRRRDRPDFQFGHQRRLRGVLDRQQPVGRGISPVLSMTSASMTTSSRPKRSSKPCWAERPNCRGIRAPRAKRQTCRSTLF